MLLAFPVMCCENQLFKKNNEKLNIFVIIEVSLSVLIKRLCCLSEPFLGLFCYDVAYLSLVNFILNETMQDVMLSFLSQEQ